ncbi:hypothetical protein [Micromonospora yangpuensis]|uniref:Uncharacterized protein n=1 Tax=Micromonospora yangpuensis TaxID=683228 RepID=A0A1C6VG27_9ACTN|nr:hypothetical protein [Micromonospora yangpuensis]GGM31422.1 hypothetical protein GCM10012279_57910 [Micromonospora yangpuensis]SCL65282.1 hypothetical protein GA0070617_5716 [Micromonospora yangpuensis]
MTHPAFRPDPAAGMRPMPRTPSGLFPSAPPAQPTYREPHQVSGAGVAAGGAVAAGWLVLFGLLGSDLTGYARWTLFAGAVAWLTSFVLVRVGDRGVATGIAIVTAGGWSIAAAVVALRWSGTGDWPLW